MKITVITTKEEYQKVDSERDLLDKLIMYPVMFTFIFGWAVVPLIYQLSGSFLRGSLICGSIIIVVGPLIYFAAKRHDECIAMIKLWGEKETRLMLQEIEEERKKRKEKINSRREVELPESIKKDRVEKDILRQFAKINPTLQVHKVFHGGCLGCQTPQNNGIGICLGCKYFDCDWSKPSLKTEYDFSAN